jgi:hypothetical protein
VPLIRGRLRRRHPEGAAAEYVEIDPGDLTGVFAAPSWLLAAPITAAAVRISADLSRARAQEEQPEPG